MTGNGYAPWELVVFNYRKTFGLTYREFLDEPADDFAINNLIMHTENEYEQYLNKRAEKKAKRT